MNELELYQSGGNATQQGFQRVLTAPVHAPYGQFIPAPGHGLGFNDLKIIECHELIRAIAGEPFRRSISSRACASSRPCMPWHGRLMKRPGSPSVKVKSARHSRGLAGAATKPPQTVTAKTATQSPGLTRPGKWRAQRRPSILARISTGGWPVRPTAWMSATASPFSRHRPDRNAAR